jgi:2-keto-4-pentenoate hydratase/2-oxohepta-3-ene-1,7-dioic acid hydratase in catechol pathway
MLVGTVRIDERTRLAVSEGGRVLVGETASLLELLSSGRRLEDEPLMEAPAGEFELDAPIRPCVLLCCGQNYSDHLAEQGHAGHDEPEFFVKAGQTIADPGAPFVLDRRVTKKLDYETELAVVIGREVRSASIDEARAAIFGYVVMNDLSARDRQVKAGGRMALGPGKNFDGATRLGSWVVTADEVPDPQRLAISTAVNGETRQSNTTANMIYGCAEIVASFSQVITLTPGTIVATGTPGGTGLGCDEQLGGRNVTPPACVPARYLEPGDVVASEIESVGTLSFTIIEDGRGGPA